MQATWLLLLLGMIWLTLFGSAPVRAVTQPVPVQLQPPR